MKIDLPRNRGIHAVAGPGAGKSTLLGKLLAYQDFMFGVPLVIIDPQGGTIDNFLYKVLQLPTDAFNALKDRITYLDMSGRNGYIPQFPLWYRLPGDSLYDVAHRFTRAIDRLDPDLRRAPVNGYNPFAQTNDNISMILHSLGLPITEAPSLLSRPKDWAAQLEELKYTDPEVGQAVDWFLNFYTPQSPMDRKRDTSTFLTKIQPILQNRSLELMLGGDTPSVDWEQVVSRQHVVLLDFRFEREPEFKMYWALTSFLEFVQLRGSNRDQPISLMIDELQFLVKLKRGDLLADDFDDLISRVARNNNIWLTLAHQEMHQFSDQMQDTLLSMGTQILGYTTKQQTALDYAARFHRYNPYRLKDTRPMYQSDRGFAYVIDNVPIYFTAQEQLVMNSQDYRNLRRLEFMIAVSRGEGSSWGDIQKITLPTKELGFETEPVTTAKERLMKRSGVPITGRALPLRTVIPDVVEEAPPPPPEKPKKAARTTPSVPDPIQPRPRTTLKKPKQK